MPERRHLGIRQAGQWRMQISLIWIAFHALRGRLEQNYSPRELDDGHCLRRLDSAGSGTGPARGSACPMTVIRIRARALARHRGT